MKKILFSLIIIGFIATSCKKDNETATPTRTNIPLKFRTQVGTNDSIILNFTADANNRLTGYTQSANAFNAARNYSFSYNTDGTLAFYDDNVLGRNRITYANGKITTKKSYDVSGTTETLRDTYTYIYSGTTVTENYTPKTGNGFIQKYSYDAKGNVIKIDAFNKSSPNDQVGTADGVVMYTNYDDKKNIRIAFPFEFLFPGSKINNPGNIVYSFGTVKYTYEYNADGYVTKRNDGASVDIYEYKRL